MKPKNEKIRIEAKEERNGVFSLRDLYCEKYVNMYPKGTDISKINIE